MNEELARSLVASTQEAVVVLGPGRELVAASDAAMARFPFLAVGHEVSLDVLEDPDAPSALYLAEPQTAYEELRAGFTAAVSHELRTPLARLLSVLESAELPGADVHGLVEQAREEVSQIRELIDDVLFLGELETGAEVVALGRTAAMPVLEEVVAQLAERAVRADLRIEISGEPGLELSLRPRMLRVIAENLVENALRYAGPGATLRLTLASVGDETVLTAADDGAGVAAEDIPRVFERFFRSDRARASRGTGLGLAIVKHIVTSAGGRVDARGGTGQGLEITCSFPA